jgi:pimeloyl-ACP methyl ester carboxylesterase
VWLKFHQEWIDKISTGQHVVTENSGHGIPFEEPELVVRTIREVVGKARSNHPGTAPAP